MGTTSSLRDEHVDNGDETVGGSPPLLRDLKVTVHHSSLVFPSQQTQRRSLFLSNIDQVLNFNVETVHFFSAHKDFPPQIAAEKLKETLAKILVPYDFLAGRLKLNPTTGRLEIDCNAAGAGFVVASSDYALQEIGDLVYPNSAFAQLVSTKPPDANDHPLCILQVTTFKCGGFAMGLSTNHTTFDGLSFRVFLDNLAALAANKPLVVIPNNDRHILAARSPPCVTFPHPELQELKVQPGSSSGGEDMNPTVFESTEEELDFKIFRLSSSDLAELKEKAAKPTTNGTVSSSTSGPHTVENKTRKMSSFNVVTALIWRCKALSSASCENDRDRESRILYAVDIRERLNPALPRSYTGNAVLSAYARGKCRELEEGPFWRTVEMVREGAERMTDEYARSVIDWGELHKGFPHGELLVSSWWKLGFAEVQYPWGRPRYSCPVVYHRKDIILLFPDQLPLDHDYSSTAAVAAAASGVNILVALPHKEMHKFQALFHNFLLGH